MPEIRKQSSRNVQVTALPANRPDAKPDREVIACYISMGGKIRSREGRYCDGGLQSQVRPLCKAAASTREREVGVPGRIDWKVERLSIRGDARLAGDIAGITIEDGARFRGSIDIIRRVPQPAENTPAGKETA